MRVSLAARDHPAVAVVQVWEHVAEERGMPVPWSISERPLGRHDPDALLDLLRAVMRARPIEVEVAELD